MSTEQIDLKELLRAKKMRLSHLATALKVHKSVTTRWAQGKVPAERVVAIEEVTGIPRHDLRPDLYQAPKRRRAQQ